MKKRHAAVLLCITAISLLSGCVGLSLGGGSGTVHEKPTLGKQLVDLQAAKDSGAITEAEFNAQKQRLLAN
jgi:Short C-terminal domain